MYRTYIALVDKALKKNADYGVMLPDFPGCVFGGKSMDEALENAREGLIFHIEGLVDDGEILPKPSTVESVMNENENKVAIPALIRIVVPTGHSKRLNISMDTGLLAEIDRTAKITGRNRSEFLADAARECLA